MENTQSTTANKANNRIFDSPPIEIERSFQAPYELVWEAWSQAELVKQWWGPEGFTCPDAKLDFKTGGKFLYSMRAGDGKIFWGTGNFQEIIPLKRIVWTDSFSDENGNVINAKDIGMTGNWPDTMLVTVEFESVDSETTRIKLRHEGIPAEQRDDCIKGWNSSLNKLQKLVEKNYPI